MFSWNEFGAYMVLPRKLLLIGAHNLRQTLQEECGRGWGSSAPCQLCIMHKLMVRQNM